MVEEGGALVGVAREAVGELERVRVMEEVAVLDTLRVAAED